MRNEPQGRISTRTSRSFNSAHAAITLPLLLCAQLVGLARADNAITPGEMVVDPPTLICLGFYWPIEGDDNHNACVSVEFRRKGDPAWRKGLNLWKTHGQMAGDAGMVAPKRMPNAFAGSIFDLEPGTQYECRLNMSDPDGVKGEAVRTVAIRTRPEPTPAKNGRILHVYPYEYQGKREQPNCNGITGQWGGVRPGDKMPQPGDIFLLHAGTYQGIRNNYRSAGGVRVWFEGTYYFVADGTPERPIVLKAAGDGEVIFDGDGCEALFDVTAADYIYLEGLTFRNARIAIRACNPRGGCAGLTVKRCKFENVGYGIRGEAEPSGDGTVYQEDYAIWKKPGFKVPRDFYIADNEVHGWRPKKSQAATLGGEQIDPECGDGIRLVGSGHVVCHNSVEGFWDNYGLHGYALDCYNNVSGVWPGGYADNACEADSSTRNVRFLRNRFDITAQPILGGPVYFIRNLGGPTKMIGGSDGVVAYHNTTGIISDFRGVPIDASDARFPSTTSTGQMLFLNNVVGTVNFGTHSLHTRFDYNAYGSGASWRYYSPTVQIMTKSFEEFREKTCHEEHGFHLAQGGNVVPGAALAPGSPLIDKACILPNVNDDFTGAGPDIGPYEFGKPLPHYGPRPIVPGSGTRK
jgi:hypothetical protein